jgi:predicted lipid-binding transport protein (Tim44 family)
MADSQLLEIIVIATIAGIVLFRLYMVLGRRTGHERPPQDYRLDGRETGEAVAAGDKIARPASSSVERPTDPVASGLFDISLADRGFDRDHFLIGARAAYEMIETAFAAGKREVLRPLLSDEVYAAFDAAISAREAKGCKCGFTFVGFGDVKILTAALKGRIAEIVLSFEARFISETTDAAGTVVEGDGKAVSNVTDIWTFSRDMRSRDPNWTLVATASPA